MKPWLLVLSLCVLILICGQLATPANSAQAAPQSAPAPAPAGAPAPTRTPSPGTKLETIWLYNPSGIRADGNPVDALIKSVKDQAGIEKPPLAGTAGASRVEVLVAEDPFAAANELFYQRGWTDGLPIIPPTDARLAEMLKGTDLRPDQVIATLDPMGGLATVEKIAVNAVMAGCRPEYMPILIAAVEAIGDPAFNLSGVQTTDEAATPLLIINGPIVDELEINSSFGLLGPGWQANATIGRAVRLIMNNIGGGWPRVVSQSGLGQPGRYTLCIAENEKQSPWDPLHVELGYDAKASTVTVVRAESVVNVTGGLVELASVMGSLTSAYSARGNGRVTVVISPIVAQDLQAAGWTKADVRQYLYDHGQIPLQVWEQSWWVKRAGNVPDQTVQEFKPGTIPVVKSPENITVVVAGHDLAITQNAYFPTWGSSYRMTKEIKLPPDWNNLLDQASPR